MDTLNSAQIVILTILILSTIYYLIVGIVHCIRYQQLKCSDEDKIYWTETRLNKYNALVEKFESTVKKKEEEAKKERERRTKEDGIQFVELHKGVWHEMPNKLEQ